MHIDIEVMSGSPSVTVYSVYAYEYEIRNLFEIIFDVCGIERIQNNPHQSIEGII